MILPTDIFRPRILAAAAAALWLHDAALAAEPPSPTPPADNPRGVYTGISDNDLYAVHNKDRHYTNGLAFMWMSPDNDVPDWAKAVADDLPVLDHDARWKRIGWSLSQKIYTPENKAATAPILDDRPYAAWLFAGLKLQTESETRLDTVELEAGVVGPAALGEQTQNHWHSLIGAKPANGWNNQLRNEPALNIVAERVWRVDEEIPGQDLGFDFLPHAVASVGNVFTYAGGGATVRFGHELHADFGPPRIDPAVPGSDTFRAPDAFGWYVFAGGQGRAVARNIFLDGNTFANSQSVSKKPLVGELQAGLALLFPRVRVTYTQTVTSKEFYGQHHPDYLGAISLSAAF